MILWFLDYPSQFPEIEFVPVSRNITTVTNGFAEVAIPGTTDKLYTYAVPAEHRSTLSVGARVAISFGKRHMIGIVVRLADAPPPGITCKPLIDIIDRRPIISPPLIELCRWMAEYYCARLADVLKFALYHGSTAPARRIVKKLPADNPLIPPRAQAGTIKALILAELDRAASGRLSISALQRKLKIKNLYAALNDLAAAGWVEIVEEGLAPLLKKELVAVVAVNGGFRARWREWLESTKKKKKILTRQRALIEHLIHAPDGYILVRQILQESGSTAAALRTLGGKGVIDIVKVEVERGAGEIDAAPPPAITLNAAQTRAIETLCAAVAQEKFSSFLLYGVTGSGKTQVYIETIQYALQQGKTAIVLVPEISLASQIVRRFRGYFGNTVAALHSRMTGKERRDVWRLAHEGKCRIVIGPRSAIFAPLTDLGVIVVDEEHESAFKQFDKMPRYHGRDVAIMRAKFENVPIVLGSATPSFESYANAAGGKYALLELPERVDNARLPEIAIVDMLAERRMKYTLQKEIRKLEQLEDAAPPDPRQKPAGRRFETLALSDKLKELMRDRLEKHEGIILLQNRRGFSPILECLDCGTVEMCDQCNITMTYHATAKHLRCHYCGFIKQPPDACGNCGSTELEYRGFGTQRVEEEIAQAFPGVRMLRMDLDTTMGRGSHSAMLKKFERGEADILLGTQMVAKGLDFSRVTLVGVVSADTQMLLPDFRSAERTFQLMTQVAGRAGRSSIPGEVVIQTMQPNHPSLKYVRQHDFRSFYDEEMVFRDELAYPPFSRIILVEFTGEEQENVMKAAQSFAAILRQRKTEEGIIILGPAAAALVKLRNVYRWQVVLKGKKNADPSGMRLRGILLRALREWQGKYKNGAIKIILDVDPVGMM